MTLTPRTPGTLTLARSRRMLTTRRALTPAAAATLLLVGALLATDGWSLHAAARRIHPGTTTVQAEAPESHQTVLRRYCYGCHNGRTLTAGLALDTLDVTRPGVRPEVWEKVVEKLRARSMPPPRRPRPDEQTYRRLIAGIETGLDLAAAADPNPGRVPPHRLNRVEYANAVRDLLAVEIDARSLLPPDESSHGFDNIAGNLALSPALFERYLTAARRVARLAVGDPTITPAFTSTTYGVPIDLRQNDRMSEETPFGSRGGLAIRHRFPLDGEYTVRLRLKKSVYGFIVNLAEAHTLDVRLDGQRIGSFTVGGERRGRPAPLTFSGNIVAAGDAVTYPDVEWEEYVTSADADLVVRLRVPAGTHTVSASFGRRLWEAEGVRQPQLREYSTTVTEATDATPRSEGPGLESITVDGPYDPSGPGQTPSRTLIFSCHPDRGAQPEPCAREILSRFARRAYRRPVVDADLAAVLPFYERGRQDRGFEGGIQAALERILIDPEFLFRLERDPEDAEPGRIHRLSDLELASRLSFFLWSSLPDEPLLALAERGELSTPEVLEGETRRMLADPRSRALVEHFAGQWLSLRNVRGVRPDPNLFPEFDENLREAFVRETELFIESMLKEDRSVLDLLRADYTFLNERLARHYGIPGVYGSHFRRVQLDDARRGGILGHGSVLTVTSYGNRTSPVLRALWVLENILGTPPPPPPADVPGLPDAGEDGEPQTVRERLSQHRRNPVCATCHAPMDPLGFALENFDATGRWRELDADHPIDASGVLPDGTAFEGPAELRRVLVERRDMFVRTMLEKLLTYALGRGVEHYDWPTIRRIARETETADHRWSALILGIVTSDPFQMRRSES